MESPDSTDAAAYAQNLKLLGDLMPAMPPDARSRAALDIARSKANIAEAVARQGYDLHGAAAPARTAAPKPPVVPMTPERIAEQARQIEALKRDFARTAATVASHRAPPAPVVPDFPNEHDHVGSSDPVHVAAIAAMKSDPTLTYRAALLRVTARRTP